MIQRTDISSTLQQIRAAREAIQSQSKNTLEKPEVANPFQTAPSNRTEDSKSVTDSSRINEVGRTSELTNHNFPNVTPDQEVPSFEQMFKKAIDTVNANGMKSGELQKRYVLGDEKIDLPEVMIAAQKSSVSFQALTQVRNRLVEAYKEIMNMPV